MHTKEFGKFVWEEELKVLGMPHFYLGIKQSLLLFIIFYGKILISAFTFLGIGGVLSIIMFICEKVVFRQKNNDSNEQIKEKEINSNVKPKA